MFYQEKKPYTHFTNKIEISGDSSLNLRPFQVYMTPPLWVVNILEAKSNNDGRLLGKYYRSTDGEWLNFYSEMPLLMRTRCAEILHDEYGISGYYDRADRLDKSTYSFSEKQEMEISKSGGFNTLTEEEQEYFLNTIPEDKIRFKFFMTNECLVRRDRNVIASILHKEAFTHTPENRTFNRDTISADYFGERTHHTAKRGEIINRAGKLALDLYLNEEWFFSKEN